MTGNAPPRTRGVLRTRAKHSPLARSIVLPAQQFIHTAGAGASVLLVAAAVALVWVNSPWSESYTVLWEDTRAAFELGPLHIDESLRELVNSGLMAIFFFVVGLEVKRELVEGELSEPRKAALPIIAAVGGMVVPMGAYLALNAGGEGARGWGIPMATDVAFALGVLALVGRRAPSELRILLLTLAVADDIGTVLVIAIFYASDISLAALGAAAGLLVMMLLLQRFGTGRVPLLLGFAFWFAVHESGVHATIAGVILGFLTPLSSRYSLDEFRTTANSLLDRFDDVWKRRHQEEEAEVVLGHFSEVVKGTEPPLDRAERLVHPWSSFVVLPVFALANAGVELSGTALNEAFSSRTTWGIIVGLLVGKVLGIVGFSWVATRWGLGDLPPGIGLRHMLGISFAAGIGFTVSIFLADIALGEAQLAQAKVGILLASVGAGSLCWLYFQFFGATPDSGDESANGDNGG